MYCSDCIERAAMVPTTGAAAAATSRGQQGSQGGKDRPQEVMQPGVEVRAHTLDHLDRPGVEPCGLLEMGASTLVLKQTPKCTM